MKPRNADFVSFWLFMKSDGDLGSGKTLQSGIDNDMIMLSAQPGMIRWIQALCRCRCWTKFTGARFSLVGSELGYVSSLPPGSSEKTAIISFIATLNGSKANPRADK